MRILVTGASGFVGTALVQELAARGEQVIAVGRRPAALTVGEPCVADLLPPGSGAALVEARQPDAVVNLAAVPDIAPAKADPQRAARLNADLPAELADACAARDVRLVHVSTDQVFDGSRGHWTPADTPAPLHVYGATKVAGERAVTERCPSAVIVRPALVTGLAPPGGKSASSGLLAALQRAAAGEADGPGMFTDEIRSPVDVTDLARALADLAVRPGVSGIVHCGGPEACSRHALALREARVRGFDPGLVRSTTRAAVGLADMRPADLSLDSSALVAWLGWTPRTLADD